MRRELGMLAALLVLCGVLWMSNKNFVGSDNAYNTARQIAMLGILAIGSSFVIVTGGIDLSVGSVVGLTGVIIAFYASPTSSRIHSRSQPALVSYDPAIPTPSLTSAVERAGYFALYPDVHADADTDADPALVDHPVYLQSGDQIGFKTQDGKTTAVYVTGGQAQTIALESSKYVWKNMGQLSFGRAVALAMVVAIGIGLAQGLMITKLNLQSFIVTLGGMLTIRGVSQTIVEGGNISFGSESPFLKLANLGFFMRDDTPLLPYLVVIAVAVVLLAGYVLHFTVFGRYLYAIGGNRDAAQYSGIPVRRVETISYVISAGLAGVAGICWASYIQQMSQSVGVAYELSAIAACVLGGFSLRGGEGTIIGVIIGTAMIKFIDNGLDMFQVAYKDAKGVDQFWHPNENWKSIVIGVVILLAVIMDQVFHIVQNRRRTKSVGTGPKEPPTGAAGTVTERAVSA